MVNQHSNGFGCSKLLALAPGAERSRCERLVLLGHLRRCERSVDGSDVPHPVSELTTCPRLGEDCWSRGLQSAVLLLVLRRGVSHRWLLPWLVPAASPLHKGLGNRDLHALPRPPRATRLVGLARPLSAETPSAAVAAAAIAVHTVPSLRAALAPQLQGLLTAELLTPLEQRRRLIAQPFTARHLQFLTPPVPHHRLEVQHLPAITQPTFRRTGRDLGLLLANVHRLSPPPVPSPAGGPCHPSSPGSGGSGARPGQSGPGAAGR